MDFRVECRVELPGGDYISTGMESGGVGLFDERNDELKVYPR